MLAFSVKAWSDLSASELYAILTLRQQVFVVEQRCAYQDCDGKDPLCRHLMAHLGRELVAYARLLPPGVSYAEPSIGRVVTSPEVRGRGFGQLLIREAVKETWERFGGPIVIGAQRYLLKFYGDVGFVPVGEPYDEDGIPHVHMKLSQSGLPAGA
jgi:ElaA protein